MLKIRRTDYLDRLMALCGKHVIKVITGIRRCGKSTLLELMQEELCNNGVKQEQIVYINFEDYDNFELRNPQSLYLFIKERLIKGQQTYIFLDEIQHVENYADVIDALFIKPDTDIYITGSNAYMLSSEIATLLSGRYVEIKMLPLSFAEYVKAVNGTNNLEQSYNNYITLSSFPYTIALYDNQSTIIDYLSGIYNTVVLKDVIQRWSIGDAMMLESVIRFVMDNIGNCLSTKRIADTMTSNGRKIDAKTIEKYLSALQQSYIIYKVQRYNIKGRLLLKTLEKYYVADVALRRVLLGTRSADIGHILENVVFLELQRRYQEVYIGKADELEIDFIAIGHNGTAYYQVAATVRDSATLKRELAPFNHFSDNYPKYLLTLDNDPTMDYNGIIRMNALDWLVGKD